MKLKEIKIENFRIFKDETSFKLAPITILTGPNSSGKSSLTKAMQLFYGSLKNDINLLDFSIGEHKLNTFPNTINKFNNKNEFIKFCLKVQDNPRFLFFESILAEFTYVQKDEENGALKEINFFDGDNFVHKKIVSVHSMESKSDDKNILVYKFQPIVFIEKINNILAKRDEELLEIIENGYLFPLMGGKSQIYYSDTPGATILDKFNHKKIPFILDEFLMPVVGYNNYEHFKKDLLDNIVVLNFHKHGNLIFSITKDFFSKYQDIFTELNIDWHGNIDLSKFIHKEFVELIYFLQEEIFGYLKSINELDEVFINSYRPSVSRSHSENDKDLHYYENLRLISVNGITGEKMEHINEAIKFFELGDRLIIERVPLMGINVFIEQKGEKINVADLGYGVSQLLPMILEIFLNPAYSFSNNNTIYFIEEPGANLHPHMQSKLADFFSYLIKSSDCQFIIETHSEYLIRKLQYLTAKGDIQPTDTQIYYFHNIDKIPEGEKQILKINIEQTGGLTNNFGKGFFDEASYLSLSLYSFPKSSKN